MEKTSFPVKRRSLRWDSERRRCRPEGQQLGQAAPQKRLSMQNLGSVELIVCRLSVHQLLSNHVGSPTFFTTAPGRTAFLPQRLCLIVNLLEQECAKVESRRCSVSSRSRNRHFCASSAEDRTCGHHTTYLEIPKMIFNQRS